MREFPKTIRIGSIDYELKSKQGLASGNSLWGEILYGNAQINVDSSLPPCRAREVLAHELAHGILFEAGYDNHDEEQANRIGKVLAMVLRDNDFGFMRDSEADKEELHDAKTI